jgi:hypothetical protein
MNHKKPRRSRLRRNIGRDGPLATFCTAEKRRALRGSSSCRGLHDLKGSLQICFIVRDSDKRASRND